MVDLINGRHVVRLLGLPIKSAFISSFGDFMLCAVCV